MFRQDFVIKQHDTLPALMLRIKAKDRLGGLNPINLSGVTGVTFSMTDQYGSLKVSSELSQITCASGGTLQYNWKVGDTDEAGKFKGEFELFFGGGGKLSLPTIGNIDVFILKDVNQT